MSGPKIDHVELERRRLAELERLRQERLNKIRAATDKLNLEIQKTKSHIDFINKHLSSFVRNAESAEEMKLSLSKLAELKSKCKNNLNKLLEINVPSEPEEILSCANKLENSAKTIVTDYHNEVKPIEGNFIDYANQIELQQKFTLISDSFSEVIEKIEKIEDIDFSIVQNTPVNTEIKADIEDKARLILSEIEELVNSDSIQETDMKELLIIAGNVHKAAFETKSSFEAAVIEYNVLQPKIIKNISLFDEAYQDYYAEYVAYQKELNLNSKTQLKIIPEEKYCFASINELCEETNNLAKKSKILMEENEIRSQIDDVMKQYNYNICEEIVFDRDQIDRHFLCKHNFEQSGIRIRISKENQIMMEIVGIEEISKTGNSADNSINASIITSSDLDNSEKDSLLSEQVKFCELHPRIVEELGKRGVIFKKLSRKQPDLLHCKKISHSSGITYNESAAKRKHNVNIKEKLREMK